MLAGIDFKFFNQIAQPVIVTTNHGEIQFANKKVCELSGYKPEVMVNTNVLQLVTIQPQNVNLVLPIDKCPQHFDVYLRSIKGEKLKLQLEVHQAMDGKFILLFDGDYQTTTTTLDESIIDSNLQEYTRILNFTDDVFFKTNMEGEILFISPSIKNLLGFEADDIIGKDVGDLYYDPTKRNELLGLIDETGRIVDYNVQLISIDGNPVDISANLHYTYDENNEVVGIEGLVRNVTERINIMRDLKESEMRYRELSRLTFEGIIIHKNGIIVDANESFCDLIGYAKNQILGKNIIELAAAKKWHEVIYNNIKNGYQGAYEVEGLRKDGSLFPAELESRVVQYKGNQVRVTAVRDITERKKAIEEMMRTEERFKNLVEKVEGVFWIKDLATEKMEYVSPQYERVWGRSTFDLIRDPKDFLKSVMSEDFDKVYRLFNETAKKGESFSVEYRILNKEGEVRNIWARVIIARNEDDLPIKEYGYAEDITDRKLTQEELRKLALVAQNTDNAVIITDNEGYIEWVNDGFTRITEYTLEDVLGKKPGQLLQGSETDFKIVDKIRDALKNKKSVQAELLNYTQTGKKYWVELNIQPIYDENGRLIKFMSIQSDITQRKLNEEAIRKHNQQLQKANQELDNFVYRVSHDLKAPISSAKGLVNLTRIEKEPLRVEQCLDMIDESMDKLDAFIKDILDYSRNTRLEIEKKPIGLQTVIENILRNLSFMPNASKVKVSLDFNQVVEFYSDPQRLNFVFNNLISNAYRFADLDKSDPRLEIVCDVSEHEAVMEFRDNGIGIEPEHQDKIFQMFYRATENRPGSGLGLYIVKESIDKIGGSVGVHSVQGEGTTFIVVIPNQKLDE